MLKFKQNVILAPFTTFKIGGPAKFFCEVKNEEEIIEALRYAKENNLEFFVLGGGSNILVSDIGFDGLVIKMLQDTRYKISVSQPGGKDTKIDCWAGNSLASLLNFAAENSLTGLEWAAGIPGTIGGAIRGNARAFGKSMGMTIESVNFFDSEKIGIFNFNNLQCEFAYWGSEFKKNPKSIIITADINLAKGNKKRIQQEMKVIVSKRKAIQPHEASAGSFFLNPVIKNEKLRKVFETEKGTKCKDEKLPAGWLIDKAGLRGQKIGGAMVSEKHSNFIINIGSANAENVIMLSSLIKQKVRDKFGTELQEEVQFIGFNN